MRKWFRIHLTTGIVLMLSAATLLWLNLRPQETEEVAYYEFCERVDNLNIPRRRVYVPLEEFGWPKLMLQTNALSYAFDKYEQPSDPVGQRIHVVMDRQSILKEIQKHPPGFKFVWVREFTLLDGYWNWPNAAWNALIALAIMLLITVLTEFTLRRREKLS